MVVRYERTTMLKFSTLKSPYFLLLILAFFIRFGAAFVMNRSLDADPDGYAALAENLREHGVFGEGETPTAFRPPLYPALLRVVYALTPSSPDRSDSPPFYLLTRRNATAFLHWVLGLLTVAIVYRLALILNFSRRWAFAAGLLVAVDPILLAQSRAVMTETLAAFLAVLIVWTLTLAMMPREKSFRAFAAIGLLAGLFRFRFFGLLRPFELHPDAETDDPVPSGVSPGIRDFSPSLGDAQPGQNGEFRRVDHARRLYALFGEQRFPLPL